MSLICVYAMLSFRNLFVCNGLIVFTSEWLISNSTRFEFLKNKISERRLFGILRIVKLYSDKGDKLSIATCDTLLDGEAEKSRPINSPASEITE